ncbi:uncharacterized protein LOC141587673 [Silene latifolia]|uniref:uncharacterized protein LOC141587673 n=1 Tax=Silene latifolia TaxID=37657 RepID=UPI003D76EAE8
MSGKGKWKSTFAQRENLIKRSVMYSETANEMWDYLQKQFSVTNGARKFRLNKELDDLEQGEKTIYEYFTDLRILWQSIELMNDWPPLSEMTPEIGAFLNAQHKEQEERKLFQFLNGLNPSYNTMRSNVLMMNLLPTAEEAAAIFQQEEAQRINYKTSTSPPPDTRPQCPACKKKGHVREKCWRVVGYLAGHPMTKYFPAKPEAANFQSTHEHAGTGFKGHKVGTSKGKFQKYPNKGRMAANAMTGEGSAGMAGAITLTTEQFEQLMSNQQGKGMSTYPETKDEIETNFAGMALNSCNNVNVRSHEWIIDSGASDHMISDLSLLENCKELTEKPKINLPNGGASHVSHTGSFQLKNGMKLNKVLYVPSFKHNLLSVQKLIKDEQCVVLFYERACALHDSHTRRIRALGKEDKGIYYLVNSASSPQTSLASISVGKCNTELCNINSYFVSSTGRNETEGIIFNTSDAFQDLCKDLPIINETDGDIWHLRLGHASHHKLKHIPCVASSFHQNNHRACITCSMAKQTKLSYPISLSKVSHIFDLVHVDVWGPYRKETRHKHKYFLTLVDDNSRATWVYLMKLKSEVPQLLIQFYHFVQTQFEKNIKILRSDNALELTERESKKFLLSKGIWQ